MSRSPVPSVSLGLPVFNGERFLRQALNSILAQQLTDFELIVSDNASTDSTPEIVQEYARHDDRIRYYRQPKNIGLARNWNFAARMAGGRFFKFVSANDEYAPTLLSDSVDVLRRHDDVVLCYGRTQFITENGDRLHIHDQDFDASESDPIARYEVVRSRFTLGTPIQSGVVRLEALRRCSYLGNYLHSDRVLTACLALYGKIVLLPDVHFFRRMGRDISTPLKAPIAAHRMFEPALERVPIFVDWRVHVGHASLMARAPLSFRNKFKGLTTVLRYAYWDRRSLVEEVGDLARFLMGNRVARSSHRPGIEKDEAK